MYTLTPEKFFVKLKRDPSLQLGCSIVARSDKSYRDNTLIICISGIDNLQTIWYPMVEAIRKDKPKYLPPILMYDRVGQGASTRKDTRLRGLPAGFQGDCLDAAHDIHDIVEHVATTRFGLLSGSLADLRIIFVGNSIGCAISRLYAQTYPRTVAGLLLLDSTIANSDTVSLFPDPMSPGFDASKLPPGATAEVCTRARKIVHQIYHPTSKNREGLWRGNLPELLPYADGPKLQGPAPGTPFVTVVEHDHSLFAQEVEKFMGVPSVLSEVYFDPLWMNYNLGLSKITEPHLSKGPIEAKGHGHLIQRDGPQFVADELLEMLGKLRHIDGSRL